MNREKNLFKNTIIITIGKLSTQLITFFLLPLYTGILSTSEYGIVDFLNTLVSLSLPLITFQVEQAVFRELIEKRNDEKEKRIIISSGLYTIVINVLIFTLLFVLIAPFVKNDYKYFLLGNVIINIFLSLFLQISRGLGENKKYAIGSFISALSTIIFNILFVAIFKFGAYGMLLGTFIGQLIASIYIFFNLKLIKYINFRSHKKVVIKKLLNYSIPLIPNAISWWIFNASDRVIVTGLLGTEKNGILAASLKFSAVYANLYGFFNMSWTESISMAINDCDIEKFFNKMFNIVMRLFISIAIGIIAVMPFAYPLLINEKFSEGYYLVPISIIASIFNVVVGLISVIYVGNKNTKAIANTSIVSAIINIIIHLSLIRFLGLYAAVISTFSSFFIMSIYRIHDINKKYIKIKIDKRIIIYSIIVLAIVLYSYYNNVLAYKIISLGLSIVFALLINMNSIKTIFEMLKKKIKR